MTNTTTDPSIQWRRIQAAGLLGVSLSLFAFLIISGTLIPPVIVFGLIYLALATVVWRFIHRRRVALGSAILALLVLLLRAPFIVEDLTHPESWGSFIPQAVRAIAGLAAVSAGFISLRDAPVPGARPFALVASGAVLLATIGSLAAFAATDSQAAQHGDVTLTAERFEYPDNLEATAGLIGFHIDNKDPLHHTFVVEGTNVTLTIPGLKERRIELQLAAGTYRFICDVPGHEKMTGTLTVR